MMEDAIFMMEDAKGFCFCALHPFPLLKKKIILLIWLCQVLAFLAQGI